MIEFSREKCAGCGVCPKVCPHGVIAMDAGKTVPFNIEKCIECGACQPNCDFDAINVTKGPGHLLSRMLILQGDNLYVALRGAVTDFLKEEISDVGAMTRIKEVTFFIYNKWDKVKKTYDAHLTSALARNLLDRAIKKSKASSALTSQQIMPEEVIKRGGIDFTDIEKYLQYDGSFKGIDLSLPLLSNKELESFDLEKEEQTLRNYLATGFNPNGDRLKCLLAGLFQRDEFTSKQLDLLRLSQELCNFLSSRGMETTPEQRAFILIANTGLYTMRQGSLTKYSPN